MTQTFSARAKCAAGFLDLDIEVMDHADESVGAGPALCILSASIISINHRLERDLTADEIIELEDRVDIQDTMGQAYYERSYDDYE